MSVRGWTMATSEAAARVPPRNRLPESPMKSRAGLRFQYRNPARLPTTATRKTTMNGPSVRENSHARNAVAISATPPASPSMLSRRFSACTTPPNQTTASSVTGHGRLRPRDPAMKNTVSAPTMREATSFASGDNCRRSSIMPRMSMAAADPGTASSKARSAGRFVSRTDAAVVASAAIANPTPPMLGVAMECHRSSRGGNQDGTPQSNSPDDGAEGKRQDRCEESQGEIGAQRPGNCTDLRRCRSRERIALSAAAARTISAP